MDMITDLANLTFIRPNLLWFLLLLVPIVFLLTYEWKSQSSWQKVIDQHLLKYMLQGDQSNQRSSFKIFLLIATLGLLIIAIAGPSFAKENIPIYRSAEARVVLLDLSLSMDSVDIKPSRLTRAKHKLKDLLSESKEGETGLIVYAGDAFVVSPLTSDANTISTMFNDLSTGIMPILGSEPAFAFNKAIELLKNAGKPTGHIVWITDGIEEEDVDYIIDEIKGHDYPLSILVTATEQGAPIPLPNNQGFLKDSMGQIVMPALRLYPLQQIANQYPTQIVRLSADSSDINKILSVETQSIDKNEQGEGNRKRDQLDQGYWVLIPVLLLFLLSFKRSARSFGLPAICVCLMLPGYSHAGFWEDLWMTKDQQAQKELNNNQPQIAAELFKNPDWKAAAHYKSGDFNQAQEYYANQTGIDAKYNLGNALAQQGELDQAIAAYEDVLKQDPDHEDAKFNKELLEKLKQQQQQQQDENEQNKDSQEQQDQKDSEQNKDQQDQQENKEDQQQKEQQESKEQENKEPKELSPEELKDERSEQEKQQALEQWLKKIPDDPGGLLREKMRREFKRRGRENRNIKEVW